MTEVEFYILANASGDALLRTACRLTQQVWGQGLRVYILLDTDEQAARLDDLLWTFQQDSFVPHERWNGAGAADNASEAAIAHSQRDDMDKAQARPVAHLADLPKTRILLGTVLQPPANAEVLINLSAAVPEWFAQCPRIVEIVGADLHLKAAGRQRYREYRELGVTLRTHEA